MKRALPYIKDIKKAIEFFEYYGQGLNHLNGHNITVRNVHWDDDEEMDEPGVFADVIRSDAEERRTETNRHQGYTLKELEPWLKEVKRVGL